MSSFLKIFPRSKTKEATERGLKGPYIPLEALDLNYSIAAACGNLSLNCKSCARSSSSKRGGEERTDESMHFFSGLLGVISKEIFMVYQLDLNFSEPFSYKNVQSVQVPHANNNPLVKPTINMARWIRLKKGKHELTVLVILTNIGVHIYSEDGSRPLCSHEYSEDIPELVCRNVGATASQILTGNGRGEVHVFDYTLGGKVISFRRTDKVQGEPIVQLCCRRSLFATGSPSGAVRVWKIRESKAYKVCCFKTPVEECVTGLGVWEGCIIATYGSGIFRIFHLQSKQILARVIAHSRWIGSMDLLAHEGLLLTVSEDDAVLIWRLNIGGSSLNSKSFGSIRKNLKTKIKSIQQGGSNKKRLMRKQPKISVQLESAIPSDNMLLVGGKFISCAGSVIALANYGAKEIYFYSRMNSSEESSDHV